MHPNGEVPGPQDGPFVLEALKILVGVDDVLLRRVGVVQVEEDLRAPGTSGELILRGT